MTASRTLHAAGLHADQLRLVARADASADAVERHIRTQVWDALLAILENGAAWNWFHIYHLARAALAKLHDIPRVLAADLHDVADHARVTTIEHLEAAGNRPVRMEAADDEPTEPQTSAFLIPDPLNPSPPLPPHAFDPWQAPMRPWEELPLFQPPSEAEINALVYSSGWEQRLAAMTRLASPDAIASIIATGFQQGLTPGQIARRIQPAVQGVQSSARRVARTESIRIAHAVQMDMYEQVPGVIAYQIHSMHFPATRHWHAARDGTIYYREPMAGSGQKGFEQMPRPPHEAPDPRERPVGTPEIAMNCICWLVPIMGTASRPLTPMQQLIHQAEE